MSGHQFKMLLVFFGSFLASQLVIWFGFYLWLLWKGLA